MNLKYPHTTLNDKYRFENERIYLSGIQSLVRLPLMQRQQDSLNNLNTAGFISGYRGSPLGTYDLALIQAKDFLQKNQIHFEPGINEDMGATAVWGSQQVSLFNQAKVDGVFGLWYGKGPGVDRSGDAIKHANMAGTAKHGGVLMLVGDDHTSKSSTFPHQSDQALMSFMIPMINPASVQDILDLGLYAIAMSRYAGVWVGLKCLSDTMDSSASVYIQNGLLPIKTPTDFNIPADGLNIRWPDKHVDKEYRLVNYRLPATQAFARANNLDKVILRSAEEHSNITIVATGKAYTDFRQAAELLNLTETDLQNLGVTIYKVALVWPLEPENIKSLAKNTKEFLVLEEKRALIEPQVRDVLYHQSHKPLVTGKKDERDQYLLPEHYEMNPIIIAQAFVKRLSRYVDIKDLQARIEILEKKRQLKDTIGKESRLPYYCSGCPHNTSTRVIDGSRAMAGIGCHYMAPWIFEGNTVRSHMGGEGVLWIGQAPFTKEEHVFVNLGDGTYQHSGTLAIRSCVAAKVNATFKILYNDAVAMTGGQKVDGSLYVDQITRQLEGEGVKTIAVVSDDIEKYQKGAWNFSKNVIIRHRDEFTKTQKEFRDIKGVSAIIYDQTCAAEKRRRRKRGEMEDPKKRIFINEMVCEGCGDCGKKSNCVSVVPIETDYGRKRQIDQSSCNKDYSCVNGFCPSFVSIEGVEMKKPSLPSDLDHSLFDNLPSPKKTNIKKRPWAILMPGIGGTGVVTVGALLAMAAHLEGKGATTMDQIGLAQKGGAVMSHIKIGDCPESIHSISVGPEEADLVIGADLIVSSSQDALMTMQKERTTCLINTDVQITGAFTKDPNWSIEENSLIQTIATQVKQKNIHSFPATMIATKLLGNSIGANMFMIGYAYQMGLIPLSEGSIFQAIELNAVAINMNKRAFMLGRLNAHDPDAIKKLMDTMLTKDLYQHREKSETLDVLINRRYNDLIEYQNKNYADLYKEFVIQIQKNDINEKRELTQAVARYLFKLMAYKDEYEVGRLYSQSAFMDQIKEQFETGAQIKFYLAPPLFAKRDPDTGHLQKKQFGPWIFQAFKTIAKMKFLRHTPFDIFGYTAERKMERQLIADYKKMIEKIISNLSPENYQTAVALASLPEHIRGFGHVKEENISKVKEMEKDLLSLFYTPEDHSKAA